MTTFFKELFQYSNHFNQLLISKLIENSDKVSEKTNQLQNHIINAHQIWNSRLLNKKPFDVLDVYKRQEYK